MRPDHRLKKKKGRDEDSALLFKKYLIIGLNRTTTLGWGLCKLPIYYTYSQKART